MTDSNRDPICDCRLPSGAPHAAAAARRKQGGERWVYAFSDAIPAEAGDVRHVVGGKGASLREMTLAGLAVPPGFTVTTACCARYFELGRKWPEGLAEEVQAHLARLEQACGRRYGRGKNPLLVSVRSGAAVSMPGMMDTILNCGLHPGLAADVGDTPEFWNLYLQFIGTFAKVVHGVTMEDLGCERGAPDASSANRSLVECCLAAYERHVKQPFPVDPWDALVACISAVFDSWRTERAVAYRQRHDIRGLAGTAVNVQMMFPSEVSGIVFTRDPNDLKSERMVVEASFGLGESVVSGDVTPDRFRIHRKDGSVESVIGHKHSFVAALGGVRARDPTAPSLTGPQLAELADLALRVEAHFGFPADIEFGWAEGKFGLLQARRIRGLEIAHDVEVGRREEIERLRKESGGRDRCWVIHNLAETLRAPTPLTWDVVRNFMKGSGGFGLMYRDLGYQPSERVCRDGFLELICGRIYADPERLAELFWDGMPLTYDTQALLADKSLLDRAPGKFDPERADGRFLAKLPGNLWRMIRAGRILKRAAATGRDRFEKEILPPYLAYVRGKREQDLTRLSDAEVFAELRDRCRRVLDEFGGESLKPGFFGGLAYDTLAGRLSQILGPERGGEMARTLTQALVGDMTFEQDAMLHEVAAGRATLAELLQKFGHRCVGEMELSVPRWREDPAYLEQTICRLQNAAGRSPHRMHEENEARRKEAERQLPHLLAESGGRVFEEQVKADLAAAQALLPYRESGKYYLMMGYETIRLAIEELGRRWDLGRQVYFLRWSELETFSQNARALTPEIEKRRIRHQSLQRLELPDVIDSRNLENLGLPVPVASSSTLTGTAMASGAATGTARIVFDPQTAGDLGTGYVLVCPSTDPGWTPLFLHACALVVERGGVLSHGAIVARDFGIPAAACPNATKAIRWGDTVRVDGNTGTVSIVRRADGTGVGEGR